MREVKQINIKNRTYYFYNDIIDIKNFDAWLLKIDKKSKILTVRILCIYLLIMRVDILREKV